MMSLIKTNELSYGWRQSMTSQAKYANDSMQSGRTKRTFVVCQSVYSFGDIHTKVHRSGVPTQLVSHDDEKISRYRVQTQSTDTDLSYYAIVLQQNQGKTGSSILTRHSNQYSYNCLIHLLKDRYHTVTTDDQPLITEASQGTSVASIARATDYHGERAMAR